MTLFTCIARCRTCKRELNRAENVPEEDKFKVSLSAPIMAVCPVRSHNNGFTDLNLAVELEWTEEKARGPALSGSSVPLPELPIEHRDLEGL